MDKYDLVFLFGAVLTLCGSIWALAWLNFGAPFLILGIIIMLVGIFAKSRVKQ